MKLWLISQEVNDGYDTYDSAVVAAETEDEARHINPDGHGERVIDVEDKPHGVYADGTWTVAVNVTAEYLGTAKSGTKAGVICASFNAG